MLRERVRRGWAIAVALVVVTAVLALSGATPTRAAVPQAQTFVPVGAGIYQTYVVPEGVYSLQVILKGGQGGPGGSFAGNLGAGGAGGLGAEVLVLVSVSPGETLTVLVGAQGSAASNTVQDPIPGGGGGGALSSISRLGTPLAIAGGGGGGGGGGKGLVFLDAGGRGGESGHDGYTSSSAGAGHGGITGPIQFGGDPGTCNTTSVDLMSCGQAGGPGVGPSGGTGGIGERHDIAPPNDDPCQGAWGGEGGQGALGGGGGGGGGCVTKGEVSVGVGGGGAGGTSALFGVPGVITEGSRQGDGEVIVVPLPGSAPPGTDQLPATSLPPSSPTAPVPAPVTVSPRYTG